MTLLSVIVGVVLGSLATRVLFKSLDSVAAKATTTAEAVAIVPSPKLDVGDEFKPYVEVVRVPHSGDWQGQIQKQLDDIERKDVSAELVAATATNGFIILFYKRSTKKVA